MHYPRPTSMYKQRHLEQTDVNVLESSKQNGKVVFLTIIVFYRYSVCNRYSNQVCSKVAAGNLELIRIQLDLLKVVSSIIAPLCLCENTVSQFAQQIYEGLAQ